MPAQNCDIVMERRAILCKYKLTVRLNLKRVHCFHLNKYAENTVSHRSLFVKNMFPVKDKEMNVCPSE